MPTFQFLTDQFGWVAALAIVLNMVLLTTVIGMGKLFARNLLEQLPHAYDCGQ